MSLTHYLLCFYEVKNVWICFRNILHFLANFVNIEIDMKPFKKMLTSQLAFYVLFSYQERKILIFLSIYIPDDSSSESFQEIISFKEACRGLETEEV